MFTSDGIPSHVDLIRVFFIRYNRLNKVSSDKQYIHTLASALVSLAALLDRLYR